ncbi:protein LDOC1L-like [Sinocyclocheilus anshuiensis]|uniref:protein LDOC1L-like n=1 Tax=Sinocyclocheilus anshuiensis TaxID=1608454 RepID=UPI0007B88864|nr:PREDICTED: protein LDOC1L-like [Sinocyclocheilus anshuiensis]
MSAPDSFKEIVNAFKRILSPAPVTPPVTPVTNAATSSSTVITSPNAKPAPFSGSADECNGFLLQCSLDLEMQPHLYTTDKAKIAFIISLLTGRALQCAETIWSQAELSQRPAAGMSAHSSPPTGRD